MIIGQHHTLHTSMYLKVTLNIVKYPINHLTYMYTPAKSVVATSHDLWWNALTRKYIEDIYFFEVNTKYISSSVLKTSEFSWVRSTNENLDVFNSWDEIYLVFTKKSKFSFYSILVLEDLQLINLLTMLQAESQ